MGAEFTISDTAFDTLGYDATHDEVLDLALEDATGLDAPRVVYSVVAASDGAPTLTLSPSTGIPATPTGVVTATMPSSGVHSYRIQCQVNEGRDSTGRTNREYTKERIVAIRSTNLELRKLVPGETTQYSSTGWTEEQNAAVDAIEAGAGGGGTTEDVEATADTLALRGPDAEVKAAWIEAPIVRTASGGDIAFSEGATTFARLRSTDAPAQVGDFGVSATGRLQAWNPGTGAAEAVLLQSDIRREVAIHRTAETSGMETEGFLLVLSLPASQRMQLLTVGWFQYENATFTPPNTATVEVRAVQPGGGFVSLASEEIVSTSAENLNSFTISDDEIPQGYCLYFQIAKGGSGCLLPKLSFFVAWTVDPTYVAP